MRLTLRPNLRSYDLIRRIGLPGGVVTPPPAWILGAGDGELTIIQMPAVAAPVAVAGDGQITIEEYA